MNRRKLFVRILVTVLILTLTVTYLVFAQAGTDEDPVISLSYLKNVFKKEVTFQVVNVTNGQAMICDEGCELILRMGEATVIATEKGGISDVTAGYDLGYGTVISGNHHLIVPLGDGRGLKAKSDCILLVKGTYTIK